MRGVMNHPDQYRLASFLVAAARSRQLQLQELPAHLRAPTRQLDAFEVTDADSEQLSD